MAGNREDIYPFHSTQGILLFYAVTANQLTKRSKWHLIILSILILNDKCRLYTYGFAELYLL